MTHFGLFEGIGGFSWAAYLMGWVTIGWCEVDNFCKAVLRKLFPKIKKKDQHDDITKTDFTKYRGTIDVLTAGFPCQKYSIAGSQIGNEPLKDEMLRAFREIEPTWGVIENVYAFISPKFAEEHDGLCKSLESMGYEVQTLDIDAQSCGLPTMERHIWIVAQAHSFRLKRRKQTKIQGGGKVPRKFQGSYTGDFGRWAVPAARVCGVAERIPNRTNRNKALGNSIPPQIAYEIFKAIQEVENQMNP